MPQIEEKNDIRLELIKKWIITDLSINDFKIEVASADASFRRYFRLIAADKSWVVMDAPPEKEDCRPFIKIAKLIESVQVQSPHIYSFDEGLGFMQLSDLGSTDYLDVLTDENVNELYSAAIQSIIKMQSIDADLPVYNEKLLKSEMALFNDWYLSQHLGLELSGTQKNILSNTIKFLTESALNQKCVFVHRDYHSRNLMLTDDCSPGVIDFQDAVNGPYSYDLVSLIKDCYIAWPREKQLTWIELFLQLSNIKVDLQQFIKALDFMGMQRHLKAIGIFSRLNYRDAKPGYMKDIPRTLAYVVDVCHRYDELKPFNMLLEQLNIQVDNELLEKIQ